MQKYSAQTSVEKIFFYFLLHSLAKNMNFHLQNGTATKKLFKFCIPFDFSF